MLLHKPKSIKEIRRSLYHDGVLRCVCFVFFSDGIYTLTEVGNKPIM